MNVRSSVTIELSRCVDSVVDTRDNKNDSLPPFGLDAENIPWYGAASIELRNLL